MNCPICNGSGEARGTYQLNDCTAEGCTAATERTALEAAIKSAEPMTPYDERWMAYGLGKLAEPEQKMPSIKDDEQFHDAIIALDISSKSAYTPAGAKRQQDAVEKLIKLIDSRASFTIQKAKP